MRLIDLRHCGRERAIGAWLADDVLIDPGPTSCMDTLLEALDGRRPRAIALTHIHLDHAGATGSLLARWPEVEVWVHERGARHMLDPTRLLASAEQLYGDAMDSLWGDFLAVPQDRLRVLSGGERIGDFRAAYTPGHARHHVAYLHEPTGTLFAGDVAGVRILENGPVIAPTPPPDVDLTLWESSLQDMESLGPERIVCTHFGVYEDVSDHLAGLREALQTTAERVARMDMAEFVAAHHRDLASFDPGVAAAYEVAITPDACWLGMRRYLDQTQAAARELPSSPS